MNNADSRTNPLKPQSNGPLYGNTVIGTLGPGAWAGFGPSSLYQM